jgi:F-type H+-transporting ATPase subunit delta
VDERIDGYAAAILEFARAEGQLERIGDELFRIARAFESSSDLREALTDPRLPVERKQAIIGDLLDDRVSSLTVNMVNFVVGTGRSADLPAIADRLAERAAAARDKVIAEVRSATELDAATEARVAEALGRATGRDVEVKTVVDPSVIGGLVARVGDVVIDGTVKHRMDQLRETLSRR